MPTEIKMPQLGESVHEGTIGKWLKQPGERVEKYEALVEVITDKVNVEMPSPYAGVLGSILVGEGQTVATGTPIALIEEAGTAAADAGAAAPPRAATVAAESVAAPGNGRALTRKTARAALARVSLRSCAAWRRSTTCGPRSWRRLRGPGPGDA